tara:strand:- start:1365 stop:2204 length:840 start_codon:yes stop_codon:yes gene_type:complete
MSEMAQRVIYQEQPILNMVWFIRRYQKGIKNSGTNDVKVSENEITIPEFVDFCHREGEGKYILGLRGKGIRGFRKITDCIVEGAELLGNWKPNKVFAAEEVSVKKNVKLSDLNDSELLDLMSSMSETDISSTDDFSKFKADLTSIHAEIAKRGINGGTTSTPPSDIKAAESLVALNPKAPLASAGFGVGKSGLAMGFVGGLMVGVVGTMMYYKSKMDTINSDLERINKQLNEAESAIKRAESREEKKHAAEQAVKKYDSRVSMDAGFLTQFNAGHGPSM